MVLKVLEILTAITMVLLMAMGMVTVMDTVMDTVMAMVTVIMKKTNHQNRRLLKDSLRVDKRL